MKGGKPEDGDVFSINLGNGKYLFARAVCIGKQKQFGYAKDIFIVYLYKYIVDNPKRIPELKKEDLLCEPFSLGATGSPKFFVFSKHAPLNLKDIYENHYLWREGACSDMDYNAHAGNLHPRLLPGLLGPGGYIELIEKSLRITPPWPSPEFLAKPQKPKKAPQINVFFKASEFPKDLDMMTVEEKVNAVFGEKGLGEFGGSGSGEGEGDFDVYLKDMERVKTGVKLLKGILNGLGFGPGTRIWPYGLQKYEEYLGGPGAAPPGGEAIPASAPARPKEQKPLIPRQAGEVFAINLGQGEYLLARIIKNSGLRLLAPGWYLWYLYKYRVKSIDKIPELKKEDLLIEPYIARWDGNILTSMGCPPFKEGNAWDKHYSYSPAEEEWQDEEGNRYDEPPGPGRCKYNPMDASEILDMLEQLAGRRIPYPSPERIEQVKKERAEQKRAKGGE